MMEKIYEDESRWVSYSSEEGDILVYARCPKCGRFLKHGQVSENMLGDVLLVGWMCKKHGEIRPHYERGE
jgi:hypothetical protein